MKIRRGQTLMEIAVSMWLLSMLLYFLLNIIPMGYLTLRKSHQLDVAAALAIYRIDETSFIKAPYLTGRPDVSEQVVLYDATYIVTREFYSTSQPNITHGVVTISSSNLTPVHFPFQLNGSGGP